jgi:hypothetical protein
MIQQTAQFTGVSAHTLYTAYLSSSKHSAMTADGTMVTTFHRKSAGDVAIGRKGDGFRAFGVPGPGGKIEYQLTGEIFELVSDRLIVQSWKTLTWGLAVNPSEITDLASTLILTFRDNAAGAEIRLEQANIPDYTVSVPETGEVGPLSQLVNTHWSLLYWEPMHRYFHKSPK